MEPTLTCRECGQEMAAGDTFCSACGHPREDLRAEAGGFVDHGHWHRPPSEFVRRIDLEQMRPGLARASVLVPNGTIGLLSVDGEVEEILRPGKRTTVTWLDRLLSLFTERLERTAFYLVDLRPIPVPLAFEAPVAGGDIGAEATATLLANVDRSSKTSLATFLQTVVRERESLTQQDLHALLADEAGYRLRQLVVDGLRRDPAALDAVAVRAAAELNSEIGVRLGLQLDLRLDLAPVHSVDVHLGTAEAPAVRTCVAAGCGVEMPYSLGFCPTCGARQPAHPRRCSSCDAQIADADAFCTGCGERWVEPEAAVQPLFTADGQQIEIDLVVRIQGATSEGTLERVRDAAAAVVAAEVRQHQHTAIVSREGFEALGQAVAGRLGETLESVGVILREVAVLDLRSKKGQWLLGARSDLELARQRMLIGREWLETEGEKLSLQEVVNGVVLRRQRLELDRLFSQRQAELEARTRQQVLDDREASLDLRDAHRRAEAEIAHGDAERLGERHRRDADHDDALAAERQRQAQEDLKLDHQIAEERQVRDFAAEGERQAMQLGSEKARLEADDGLYSERRQQELQLEKMRAMTELDREIADADHGREMELREVEKRHQKELAKSGLSEAELLAVQAAELAGKEHGDAAFRALEGSRVAEARQQASDQLLEQADASRRELKEVLQSASELQQRTVDAALSGLREARGETAEAYREAASQAASMAERGVQGMADVRSSSAAPASVVAAVGTPVATTDCKECGQELAPPYRFCGRCGSEQ